MALQPTSRACLPLVAAVTILLAVGCEKPTVAEGSTATVGGVEFTIGDYQIRYLEVTDSSDTYEYPQPALVIPITATNVGEGSYTYTPSHTTQQMSEAQTPLLYHAPTGEKADELPPANKTMINGVFLAKGTVDGQLTKNETVNKGESVSDLLLFEVPDAAKPLILSIPPALHRGTLPVLFKIDFKPTEPMGPKFHKVGESVAFGTTEFTVTSSGIEYVKTRDNVQGEGYSSDPLLKVTYEIENKGSDAISFDAAHRSVGDRGASLYGKGTTFKRVRFASSTRVEGQLDGTTLVEAGQKVTDFVLFDRPPDGTEELSFEYPARLFGGSGLARFTLSYEYADPAKPAELTKPKPKPDPDKGG